MKKMTKMTKFDRDLTLSWLISNQSDGFFDGFPEENMDFNNMPNNELRYYYEEWIPTETKEEWL